MPTDRVLLVPVFLAAACGGGGSPLVAHDATAGHDIPMVIGDALVDHGPPPPECLDGLHCWVGGRCFADGEADPALPCHACVPPVATDRLVPHDGLACDDGDPCTLGDKCKAGACVSGLAGCNDQNPCTDDACTDGKCVNAPLDDTPCDDASACTTGDVCHAGQCVGAAVDCPPDANPCTDDSCDPATGCVHPPNDDPCDDGNACTAGERCEDGECRGGGLPPECDDHDPCTDDGCAPASGCTHIPNTAPCDDGDPCTVGDRCRSRTCEPGTDALACDDGNPCTDDSCTPGVGCATSDNEMPCDDGDPCFEYDTCAGGACRAGPVELSCEDFDPCTTDACVPNVGCSHADASCDDGEACTKDWCEPFLGCMHEADPAAGCGPTIRLDKPPRGATLKGDPNVNVAGHATQGSDAWPIISVAVNDLAASLETDGDFSVPVYSSQGINPLLAIATDDGGQTAQASRSYAFSTKWYAIDAANPSQSMVADGADVFLAAETWDSNGMHVDVASLVEAYVNGMDFNTLFKNPVTSGSYSGCSYQVNVTNVQHGQIDVALRPVAGGLDLDVVMYDFSADIAVPMGGICPDVSGTASAPMVELKATLKVTVSAGKPVVQIQNVDVQIVPQVEVVVDGIWGFLFNWLVDWFQDTLTGYIEDAIETQMGAPIEGAIADVLAGFALDQAVTVPAFLPGATPVTLTFKTKLSTITFTDAGSVIGLAATVVAPKKMTHGVLGSIGRAGCLSGWEEPLYFPGYGAAEMGLHDDVLNQVAYAMWWGGGLKFPVDPSLIPQDLSEYGVADLKADVDFLLPPIVTSCNWSEQLQVQVGEVGVHATFEMFGSPSEILMYATVIAPAYLYASGDQIGFALDVPTVVRMDVASASGGLEGGADKITGMIEDQLLPVLMDAIRDKAFVSFPIPSVDLGKIHPAFAGQKLTIAVQQVMRSYGYTVLSGSVN